MGITKSINIDSYQANLKALIQHYGTFFLSFFLSFLIFLIFQTTCQFYEFFEQLVSFMNFSNNLSVL